MVSFIARGLLIAAFAALVAAGTAPASVPDDTIYLYSDTNVSSHYSNFCAGADSPIPVRELSEQLHR